jgi:hypothetical protein
MEKLANPVFVMKYTGAYFYSKSLHLVHLVTCGFLDHSLNRACLF